ncbi:hypothetical protein [Amycolatopsis plumensis]|uniref:Uncharacterized protein n=1 Tax=Amycolatopsis plumensis TaxID=236508 RepID=A0ABV5UAR5_9PSEU
MAERFRAAVTHGFRTIDLGDLTEAARKFAVELEKVAKSWAGPR